MTTSGSSGGGGRKVIRAIKVTQALSPSPQALQGRPSTHTDLSQQIVQEWWWWPLVTIQRTLAECDD